MKRYEKKLKWTLILFLGFFALLINLATFYIITASLEKNHAQLAKSHMEHKYQNCQWRMAVLEQQFLTLADDPQFVNGVEAGSLDILYQKLKDYLQSSQGVEALAVYADSEGSMKYLAGDGELRYISRIFSEAADGRDGDIRETVWYIAQEDEGQNFSVLCPVKKEERQVGWLLVKFSINSFMSGAVDEGTYDLWEEHRAIASKGLVWSDDFAYWSEAAPSFWQGENEFKNQGKVLLSSRDLTTNGVYLCQVVQLKMDRQYLTIAVVLATLFLLAMLGICFSADRLIGGIMKTLWKIKRKMEQLH